MYKDTKINSDRFAIAMHVGSIPMQAQNFALVIGKYQAYGLVFSVELLEIKVVENALIGPIPLQTQKSNSHKHEFDANSARVLIPGF